MLMILCISNIQIKGLLLVSTGVKKFDKHAVAVGELLKNRLQTIKFNRTPMLAAA